MAAAAYTDFHVDGDFLHYKVGGKHCVWDSNNKYSSRNDKKEISKLEPHVGHWVTSTGRGYTHRRSTIADLQAGDGHKYRKAVSHLNDFLESKYRRERKTSWQRTSRNTNRNARNNAEPSSAVKPSSTSIEGSASKPNSVEPLNPRNNAEPSSTSIKWSIEPSKPDSAEPSNPRNNAEPSSTEEPSSTSIESVVPSNPSLFASSESDQAQFRASSAGEAQLRDGLGLLMGEFMLSRQRDEEKHAAHMQQSALIVDTLGDHKEALNNHGEMLVKHGDHLIKHDGDIEEIKEAQVQSAKKAKEDKQKIRRWAKKMKKKLFGDKGSSSHAGSSSSKSSSLFNSVSSFLSGRSKSSPKQDKNLFVQVPTQDSSTTGSKPSPLSASCASANSSPASSPTADNNNNDGANSPTGVPAEEESPRRKGVFGRAAAAWNEFVA